MAEPIVTCLRPNDPARPVPLLRSPILDPCQHLSARPSGTVVIDVAREWVPARVRAAAGLQHEAVRP